MKMLPIKILEQRKQRQLDNYAYNINRFIEWKYLPDKPRAGICKLRDMHTELGYKNLEKQKIIENIIEDVKRKHHLRSGNTVRC